MTKDILTEMRALIADWRSRYNDMHYGSGDPEDVARMEGKEDAYGVAADELEAMIQRWETKNHGI